MDSVVVVVDIGVDLHMIVVVVEDIVGGMADIGVVGNIVAVGKDTAVACIEVEVVDNIGVELVYT